MVTALLLSSSLWLAAQAERPASNDAFQAPLVVPVEKISDALAIDYAFIGGGTGADLLSTDYYLNNSNGRCVEMNPRGQRVEGRVALKIGAASLRAVAAYFLRRYGHRNWANGLRWFGLAVDAGVTANNLACVWR